MNATILPPKGQHELIDIYSQDGTYLGAEDRTTVHDRGYLHYAVHCWVWGEYCGKHVIAFQKRKQTKRLFPGKYDVAAAGHYLTGEYGTDGIRELEEELGISKSLYSIRYYETRSCSYHGDMINNKEICNVFFCHLNTSFSDITFLQEEIDDVIIGNADDYLSLFRGESSSIRVFSICRKKEISVSFEEFVVEYRDYFINTVLALQDEFSAEKSKIIEKKHYSFVMIKPDAIDRLLVSHITEFLVSRGYTIELFDILTPEDDQVYLHYSEKIAEEGEKYRIGAYKYFHGKLVAPTIISNNKESIIQDVRKLIGYKDPAIADKASIRGMWGVDSLEKSEAEGRCCENLIHACDSYPAFKREALLWFKRAIAEKYMM